MERALLDNTGNDSFEGIEKLETMSVPLGRRVDLTRAKVL